MRDLKKLYGDIILLKRNRSGDLENKSYYQFNNGTIR